MRVLLFNDNPVVTKLVTLSAQKTGDELEVCSDLDSLKNNEVDLLIVDDGLYNDESALTLGISVSASQHLFMANRGSSKPEGFEHTINKPFLPTDLVELFTEISNSLENTTDDEESLELESLNDELTLETPELEDENELDIDDNFDDLDIPLDLDSIEAEDDMLLDLDNTLELDDAIADEDTDKEVQESVLDKDDLAEVQSLLDDADDSLEDTISVGSLDDFDDLGLDIDEEILEDSEEESDANLDDLSLELDEDEEKENEPEKELTLDTIEEDELLDLDLHEAPDEALDDEALNELEDEIQDAISELSDEELEESVDEDILLDIVSSDESLTTFSGLDDLDEESLKVAVGETEASVIPEESIEDIVEDDEVIEDEDIVIEEKNTKVEGVEALKILLKALGSDNVVNSLKGMNITINISFGGED